MIKKFIAASIIFGLLGVANAQEKVEIEIAGTKVDIPIPEGYVNGATASPNLHKSLVHLGQAGGKSTMQATLLDVEDVKANSLGSRGTESSYFKVETVTVNEKNLVTQQQFEQIRKQFLSGFNAQIARAPAAVNEMVEKLKKEDGVLLKDRLEAKPGEIIPISLVDESPQAFTYTIMVTLVKYTRSLTLLNVTSHVLVKKKVLLLSRASHFNDSADISRSQSAMSEWIKEVRNANK